MLGKEERQVSFFDTGFACAHLIKKNSFYAKMREHADSIISDNDFADIYCLNNGRPSVPPARLAKVLILQHYEGLSDREVLQMLRLNIAWKYALNVPVGYEGFDRSLLTYFRARLITNNKEKMLFRKTLELAKKAGLLKGKIDQVIDSTPMLGAGAVRDTYELIRDGIKKTLLLVDKKRRSRMNLSLNAYGKKSSKPKINWDDKKERTELLSLLVLDARKILSHVDLKAEGEGVNTQLQDTARLLSRILSQDIEEDKNNKSKIRQGVAKDRIISTTDPEMRHGRKSSAGKFNGYKTHITKDVASDIITNVDVSPANCPDGKMTEPLIEEAEKEYQVKTKSLCGDGAYSSGKIKEKMDNKRIELISKVPVPKDTGKFTKEDFQIDLAQGKVTCPEGKVAEKCRQSKNSEGEVTKTFVFRKETCLNCQRGEECTKAKRGGRTISVGPHEEYLREARKTQKTDEFKRIYNERRPPVERKIAELIRHGLRKTRYIGGRKSRLQALFTASVVNLKLIFKDQEEKAITCKRNVPVLAPV
jgi:transposase